MTQTQVMLQIKGRVYRGRFEVSRDLVTVHATHGTKSAHVGTSPVEVIARILLWELVQAEMKRKDSMH
jgi:hypothetical protein